MWMPGRRPAHGSVPTDAFLDRRDPDLCEPGLAAAACACGWFSIGQEAAVESASRDHQLDACAASLDEAREPLHRRAV
jgi:hypothetical protein